MEKNKKRASWLLPTVLILFICEILTLPLIVFLTYAGKSATPDHTLTLTGEKLVWDENTKVRDDGTAELSLFSTLYDNVNSDNGDKVFAPGTDAQRMVRLKNDTTSKAEYTATLYMIKSSETLPITARLECEGGTETDQHVLPDGVDAKYAITSFTGTAEAGVIVDFDIDWYWLFEVDDAQDLLDTAFGDKAAEGSADDAIVGLYIVVNGEEPQPPVTGENTMLYWFLALIAVSGVVLILTLVGRRRRKVED